MSGTMITVFVILLHPYFGVFAWAAYIAFERNEDILPWVFIVLAIIFNPILKILLQVLPF
jgi:hypothetical protein